jgi:ADP-heptose:LPS heptosyltransferase
VPYICEQPEILRYLDVVVLVGAQPITLDPHLAVTAADRAAAAQVVPPAARPLVALHPGVSHPGRRWPAESFAVVGHRLCAAGAEIVVTGTEAERRLVTPSSARWTTRPTMPAVDSRLAG